MARRSRRVSMRRASFWLGLASGFALATAALELPYVNWQAVVPPIDQRPLTFRQDAGGRGHFAAPRSGKRHHRGIDLAAAIGSPVRAIRSGTVIEVGTHRGLGRFVKLDHRRLSSLYAHLSDVYVEAGDRIRQGQVIGAVGKTGNARHAWILPHLHLEVVRGGEPIDPQVLGFEVVEPHAQRASLDVARDARPELTEGRAERSSEASHAGGGE